MNYSEFLRFVFIIFNYAHVGGGVDMCTSVWVSEAPGPPQLVLEAVMAQTGARGTWPGSSASAAPVNCGAILPAPLL